MIDYSRILYIDVASCNLKCVMCPRGGISGLKNESRGLMSVASFMRIVDKFICENIGVSELLVGNWGEPLLNPDLPKMIRYFRGQEHFLKVPKQIPIYVSTNLNYMPNPIELLESGINVINISISGMTQDVYSINHQGGDINKVLKNVLTLAKIREQKKINNTCLQIFFLELVYNNRDRELARKFCQTYGLRFRTYKAFIPTIEDNINLSNSNLKLKKLYGQYLDLDRESRLKKQQGNSNKCAFLDKYVTINFDERLYRCCLAFDEKWFLGSFFTHKIKDIPSIKSGICPKCQKIPMYNRYFCSNRE